jgi:metal-responsive CopG/Arc/MetJ family transcriptional regulator
VISYTTVKIPDPLLNEIERVIKNNPQLGYRNRSEFIMEAIREKIESVSKMSGKQ